MTTPQQVRSGKGYQEYRELAAKTPLRKYPWKTMAGNIAGIAAAHTVGYYTAGALAKALSKTPLAKSFSRLDPHTQRRVVGHLVGAAGTAGTVAASLASLAGQARVAEELGRLESQEKLTEGTKVATVSGVYAAALREL